MRALSIKERTASVGHREMAVLSCGSISIGLGMLREEKLFHGLNKNRSKHWRRLLWRPGRMNRPRIVYQALWAMPPISAAEIGRAPKNF